ncbi:MAG: ABC transporter ATP-binding protein [Bacillus sp. (in: Bacteria)]|nr:ABC transporter ATP-binding protein [Bacillus sp. (in: firmicutes)]MCM1427032.1 ABC transporter ATP-binding protein [Eubacterium sp.]
MIKVENLVKKYGTRVAVKDLSFTVQKGQIYGFLGPNGAGKTTTINIMTGYLAATSGTVTINGYDIQEQPKQAKKCIGYLPEIPPLYPDMTVLEYLRFAAQLKSVPKKEQSTQIQEIMDMVGIADVKTRLIKNLSKGYKQRVGMAQAIIGYPEVIILDEPMVGLDPKQILETRSLIKKLSEQHTIILSSHILSEISTVCDHILIIAGGSLVASGSPEDLQKLMDTSTQIAVTVSGTEERAREVIGGIGQVRSYELEASGEEITIKIITKENADIRKELSVALTNAGMPVLAMNKVEKSLEDIFIQLTDASHAMEAESDVEEEKDDSDL